MTYETTILADTPIHYWRLGEASLPLVDGPGSWDMSTSAGITFGSTSLIPLADAVNKAITSTTGNAQMTGNATIPPVLSIECWVRPTSNNSNTGICGAWNASSQGTMLYFAATNVVRFYTSSTFLTGPTLSNSTTYHLVATFDGTNRRIYLNGSLTHGPTAGTTPEASPARPWQISGYQGTFGCAAVLDEVALYDYALSAGQVAAHYTAGASAPSVGRSIAVIVG